jgi:DNA polymerase
VPRLEAEAPKVTSQIAAFDFETASEAGYVWHAETGKWKPPQGGRLKGLPTVGAAAYAEHPSTRVLTLSYRLPGQPVRRWKPGQPAPTEVFDYLAAGGLLEAHNVMFERLIWKHVCTRLYGWPDLEPFQYQLRCSMATARVNSLPGALANLGDVLGLDTKKDADGKRLLDKFSMPRNPTKADLRTWITPDDDPDDAERLYAYCDRDVTAETAASDAMLPMSADELRFWLIDQEINMRGIGLDRAAVRDCIVVLEQALAHYGEEFRELTGGLNPTQLEATKGWLSAQGVWMTTMDEAALDEALARDDLPAPCRRALEIRQRIGSASVKKLYAMENTASADNRIRNTIIHHGARTGRPTGDLVQPLNLPKSGPDLRWCGSCARPAADHHTFCPWCAAPATDAKRGEWKAEAVDAALEVMAHRDLGLVEWFWGDALLAISGCIRSLFVAAPGHDLIASDFSSIEAVVLAQLAGERWRIEAFERGDPIYLVGASKITGRDLQFYLDWKERTGAHHEDRQKIGKVSELACGYGGWVGSYKAFGSQEPDDVIKQQILGWRAASPTIPEFWGGQYRGMPWEPGSHAELYGVEGHAIAAIQNPGVVYEFRGLRFYVRDNALRITLLSGRELTYHSPRLVPTERLERPEVKIIYWTWNSNPKYGAMGWGPMETYGGRLTENIDQAIAHDILRFAIENLRAAGYPTVLHVYDEIIVEVPHGTGSIEEVERIMGAMPPWAVDSETGRPWPIRAEGGWRGRRYRKG